MLQVSPDSVWMRENVDQKNSEYGHFTQWRTLLSQNKIPCKDSVLSFIQKGFFRTIIIFVWYAMQTILKR